jgi:hypothetical protein
MLYSRGDIIDVPLDVLVNVVSARVSIAYVSVAKWLSLLIAADCCLSSGCVFEEVVLGLKKRLRLRSTNVQLHPLLVDRLRDPLRFDTGILQPAMNSINALFGWRKEVVYLLRSVVFSVRLGVWIRPGKKWC